MTNGKKDKMTNNDLQHTTNKAEVWVTQTHYNRDWTQVLLKGQQFMLHTIDVNKITSKTINGILLITSYLMT